MAVNYMNDINISNYDPQNKIDAFEYDQTLVYVDTELTSDPIIIPCIIKSISVTLGITAGSGKVQTTTNKLADVISGTNVVWTDWDSGTVTSTTQDVCDPVTAIRFICSTGTVRIMIRAQ